MSERKYQHFAVVAVLVTLVPFCMAIVQYKVPTIMISLMGMYDMDASAGSWLMSIFTLIMVFVAVPASLLVERLGARRVVVVASAFVLAGSVVGALAPNAAVLMFSRALEGAGLTAMTTAGPVLIEQSVSPAKIGSALGIWGVWGPGGSFVASIITPALFALTGMTVVWLLYAVFVLVAMLLLLVCVRPADGGESPTRAETVRVSRWRDVFGRDSLLVLAAYVFGSLVTLAVLGLLPSVLQVQGMDQTLSGLASALPMLISLVSAPVFGALLDKTGNVKMLSAVAFAGLGVGAFLMFTQHGAPLWAGAVITGALGMGTAALLLPALYMTLPYPELKAKATGAFMCATGVGQFLGTFLVQMVLGPGLDNVWPTGVSLFVVAIVGAACVVICRFSKTS